MSAPEFPEYGHGGDFIGSRRTRRSFRFFVVACLVLTGGLWFAEQFLRHSQTERLYLRALTLDPGSARPFLRQAVKLDEQLRQFPTPKYWLALASREEEDRVLDTFERAYRLDPDNPGLAIRYGCRLLEHRRPAEARVMFREAAENAPDNVLPLYLEAASLPWIEEGDDDPRRSLAMVAKANSSGQTIMMPRPLWFSDLPQDGYWYAELRRSLIQRVCHPIRLYGDYVNRKARESITAGRVQYWDSWLEHIEGMGQRLLEDSVGHEETGHSMAGAALQALHGVEVQLDALRLREVIRESEGLEPDESLAERRRYLEEARAHLREFEANREALIEQDWLKFQLPLFLIGEAIGVLAIAMLGSIALSRFARRAKAAWTLPHGRSGMAAAMGGAVVVFVLLCLMSLLCQLGSTEPTWEAAMRTTWRGLLAVMVGFGLVYPLFRLPSASRVCQNREGASEAIIVNARHCRRLAYIVLLRRYYGLVAGLVAIAMCFWVVWHRIVVSLYPWQTKLLATGLVNEEVALVKEVLTFLL